MVVNFLMVQVSPKRLVALIEVVDDLDAVVAVKFLSFLVA